MGRIVSVHSFRGGTGKSNITANLAALTALRGRRVGVVDTDVQSPGIHVLFGFDEERVTHALNDYLWDRCPIEKAVYEVTASLGPTAGSAGARAPALFLIPSSLQAGEIARVLSDGYDVGRLNDGFRSLIRALTLDVLFIDTHPGVNEETLLSIAISDLLVVVLRTDHQDYQGTAVTVDLARRLEVPEMVMVVNKVLPDMDPAMVAKKIEASYGVPVACVLPLSEDVTRLASEDIFSVRFPDHPVSRTLVGLADRVGG
jgi:MinD-like ATPase involved in chromosome partitioning or flagellar assembly